MLLSFVYLTLFVTQQKQVRIGRLSVHHKHSLGASIPVRRITVLRRARYDDKGRTRAVLNRQFYRVVTAEHRVLLHNRHELLGDVFWEADGAEIHMRVLLDERRGFPAV